MPGCSRPGSEDERLVGRGYVHFTVPSWFLACNCGNLHCGGAPCMNCEYSAHYAVGRPACVPSSKAQASRGQIYWLVSLSSGCAGMLGPRVTAALASIGPWCVPAAAAINTRLAPPHHTPARNAEARCSCRLEWLRYLPQRLKDRRRHVGGPWGRDLLAVNSRTPPRRMVVTRFPCPMSVGQVGPLCQMGTGRSDRAVSIVERC